MVIRKALIEDRLKQLDTILQELLRYHSVSEEELLASLSLRWTVERGLLAAASQVFDVAEHILSGLGAYPETYEDSLRLLKEKKVVSAALYRRLKGLGGFRNVLVHEYVKIDLDEVHRNLRQAFKVFPAFSAEVQDWLALNR
jgi:uncharacterized protein YutE (UPF0331/DUF86 family)